MLNVPDDQVSGADQYSVPIHVKKDKLMRPGVESKDEDQIQESIDNLDMLLANLKAGKKDVALKKLGDKYGVHEPRKQ